MDEVLYYAGYDDAFYLNDEEQSVIWMYYNPDSFAGGQFVTNYLSYCEVIHAAKEYKDAEGFFDYLGSVAYQTLADVGTEWFEGAQEEFRIIPDFADCTYDTMDAIVKRAKQKLS